MTTGPSPTLVVVSSSLMLSWEEARACLPPDEFEVVRALPGVRGLLACCRKLSPCLAIAPQNIVQESLSEGLSETLGLGRLVRLVVLIENPDPAVLEQLLLAGCAGFLSPHPPPVTCQKVLRAIQSGEIWVSRRLLGQALLRLLTERNAPSLSEREEEILKMLGQSRTNRQIAESLSISGETVRWHLRRLHRKLGTTNRAKIVAYAVEYAEHGGRQKGRNSVPPTAGTRK